MHFPWFRHRAMWRSTNTTPTKWLITWAEWNPQSGRQKCALMLKILSGKKHNPTQHQVTQHRCPFFAHLPNECPCLITYRKDMLRNMPVINSSKWKPRTLLNYSNIDAIDEALSGAAAYQLGNTSSRTITEVKQRWAWLVLGWTTVQVLPECCC